MIHVNGVNNINITIHNHIYNNQETMEANKQAIKKIVYSKEE